MIQPPGMVQLADGSVEMEVSVHQLMPALQAEVLNIFPGAPPHRQMLAIVTIQFARGGVDLAPDCSCETLQQVLATVGVMHGSLTELGRTSVHCAIFLTTSTR